MPDSRNRPSRVDAALAALARRREQTLEQLAELVRIPGVSAAGFDAAALEASARKVAEVLSAAGLERVEVLHHGAAPPFVVAEWSCPTPGAPTLLIYGHHDVQPPGDLSRWLSPPWEPEQREGRLYGRGVVDDKAGIMAQVAAVRAWMDTPDGPPVNLKFIIEGEEEIGSPHLEAFLSAHARRLAADCLLLTDTCNLDTGVPSLTTSLRGLVVADVAVASLEGPLHSGIWGGPIPDPVQALARILARLSDERGRPAVPGIDWPQPPPGMHDDLPFDAERFRAQGGVLPGVPLLTQGGAETCWSMWNAPVITVSALDAPPLAGSSNQIVARVRARVGLRLAPGQDAEKCRDALVACLENAPPWGCRVEVTPHTAAGGWETRPDHPSHAPVFAAARRALEAGYGHPAAFIGCGGSIPFVEPFARALGGVPALLLGVEDPPCRAHGENESLHLGDFDKACRATVHLFAEVAAAAKN